MSQGDPLVTVGVYIDLFVLNLIKIMIQSLYDISEWIR